MKTKKILMLTLLAGICLPAMAQYDIIDSVAMKDQLVDIGANKQFTREESTAAVSVITTKDVNKRGGRNIGNSILGQGNGLVALEGSGLNMVANPSFYVRGLQSLNGTAPLIMVDGIERDIDNVVAEDVESVQILKDAAATALYGYKGANGAILIKTKHGSYNSRSITFSYDHTFSYLTEKPKFVNAATYASAVNEAYRNQGEKAIYSDAVINAYADGSNPLYYPNVDWVGETFRNVAHNNRFNLEFKGGSKNFRYYTNLQLVTDKGFIGNPTANGDGYSTQDKYTRANLRSNMDIDLSAKTKLHTHIYGVLTEQSQPGSQADLWNMVYTVPSNAFPIRIDDETWGGNTVYTTNNPVAQSIGTAYYKNHQRALYADVALEQDLSAITPGLSANVQVGYDTWSNIYEDHSKTYVYGFYTVKDYKGGIVNPEDATLTTGGSNSNMGTAANNNAWIRRCIVNAAFNYDRSFGKNDLYGQLKFDYEYNDATGTNTTVYRQNYSLMAHYGYDKRYLADVALIYSGSSRLAPDSKWGLSPTASLGWNIHNEKFMQDTKWVNFLKLRTSFGLQQLDVLPGDNVWTYYRQFYAFGSPAYSFDSTGSGTEFGNTGIAQAATQSLGREKATKFNVGLDATLFGSLNVALDYYYQHRYDIWCSTSGSYTSVFGLTAPYENVGVMNSSGFEVALDYSKQWNEVTFNIGGNINFMSNTIKDQAEEPRLHDNLVRTGYSRGQVFGYVANGFFSKDEDTDKDGIISAEEMKAHGLPVQSFTTIRPGDVKYQDITGDGIVDANDVKAIGKSASCPETVYNFHLGAEWKGIGLDAVFQGVGGWTGIKNTNGMFRSAVATNTLSEYLYENSWSEERGNTANPLFPRLSTATNANNDQTSTLNIFSRNYFKLRNVEMYYYLPECLLTKTGFINKAKIYVRGIDLFTIDDLKNGDAASYGVAQPLTRSLQIGAQLTF
ncbi:MAG: SusC/RagA family TonB-linked outer membrane protein [Prevotella sp.]|nr:SusC/RagA family TonB-linked outer membrane protein [Candidatus Equicola faecalis]